VGSGAQLESGHLSIRGAKILHCCSALVHYHLVTLLYTSSLSRRRKSTGLRELSGEPDALFGFLSASAFGISEDVDFFGRSASGAAAGV
jgi:hypothetical protein